MILFTIVDFTNGDWGVLFWQRERLILGYRRIRYFQPHRSLTMVFPKWRHHWHWCHRTHTVGPRLAHPRVRAPSNVMANAAVPWFDPILQFQLVAREHKKGLQNDVDDDNMRNTAATDVVPNISTKDDGEQRVVLLGGTNNSPGDRSVSSSPLWWEEALQSVLLWRDQELLVQRKETPHVSSSESPERVWPPHALSFLWVTSSRPHSGEDESNES